MGDKAKIVLIEDEEGNRRSLTRALDRVGYDVHAFATAEPALDFLRENNDVALVITDLMLPGIDGFGVLRTAREISPEIGVLMVTGHGSVESAVEAMKAGADDYLTKPVELFELRKRTSAILEKRKLVQRVNELEVRLSEKFGQLIGHTKQMEDLFRQMELVAAARANVLIAGDSGTGKELVANALHDHSPRAAGRFMPINCAAIPAEILESELFGHERGAFTGAAMRKVGKFELADGGTLFLDEISELPLEMQVKLLRVLEQREFMRVGGTETIKVDIRLIAATNQDLESLVEDGRFRNDLYYRLKVVTIQIPPLRERREDIPMLVKHFVDLLERTDRVTPREISRGALERLQGLEWAGNVRELRNTVERLLILSSGDLIEETDVEFLVSGGGSGVGMGSELLQADTFSTFKEQAERAFLLQKLREHDWNVSETARAIDMPRSNLYKKMERYGLARED